MFHKDTFRLIKKTVKRFVTILLIVIIGASFMVGLMSCEATMKTSVDRYFKATDFMDLQLFSSFGFDDGDIAALQKAEEVKTVEGSKFVDAFTYSESGGIVTRVSELDTKLNKYTLTEGRMPARPDEALALGSSSFGSVFAVGDVAKLYLDDEDITEKLAVTQYKIVGIVKTPLYMASSRETSTLKNLALDTVIFVDNQNLISEYYTSLYLTFEGAHRHAAFTDGYGDFVQDNLDSLDPLFKTQEKVLSAKIIEDVKQEIADGEKELAEETAKAEKELADGRQELADARQDIAEAEQQIADGWKELEKGKKELNEGKKQLKDSQKQLEQGKTQLVQSLALLGVTDWQGAVKYARDNFKNLSTIYPFFVDIEAAVAGLTAADPQANKGRINMLQAVLTESKKVYGRTPLSAVKIPLKATVTETVADLQVQKTTSQGYITAIEGQIAAIIADATLTDSEKESLTATLKEQLRGLTRQITLLDNQLSALTQLSRAYATDVTSELLDRLNRQLTQVYTLYATVAEITAGQARIDSGFAQIEKGEREIEKAGIKLENARIDLEDGKKEYAEGLRELADGERELAEETEKALIDIAKAKQDLADLPEAEWTILDRDSHYSTTMFESNSIQMGKIGMVFPLLFFLVAALVCMTTMKRLIDEERGQIGIFSALGFSKRQIISKYLIYAFSASITGSVVAIPLGIAVFPTVVYFCWRLMYDLPDMVLTMPWYIRVLGVCAFTLIMVGVTYTVAKGVLKENPSALMRPKAPKNAKKVFLENIGFIWRRLSFTSKVTARNIIRYKSRFFMTVIGVAGCTGLLVLGFAIKDSVSEVVDLQYSRLILYESTINISEDATYRQKTTFVNDVLPRDENVTRFVPNLSYSAKITNGDEEDTAQVYVTAEHRFEDIFNIRDRKTGKKLPFSGGVIISEKFAKNNNISVGDTVEMESFNEIRKDVPVTGICEMYAGHYRFMATEDYCSIFGESRDWNNIAVQAKDAQKLATDYTDGEFVESVSDFTNMKATFNNMFDSLDVIIMVITACAGSLALVVIMNLTEVNISERIREIATLKVLGFNNKEVYSYIFKEVFILALLGIFIGLPLGRLELNLVMTIIDMEMVMFPLIVKPQSYIFSFGITLGFTVMVILLMRKTLRNVKMVESLKSVE